MVVGTLQAPPTLHPFAPTVCSVSPPMPALPCQQRIPLLPGNHILTVHTPLSCGQAIPATSTVLQYQGNVHGGTTSVTMPTTTTMVPTIQTLVPYSTSPVQGGAHIPSYASEKTAVPCPTVVSGSPPAFTQLLPPQIFTNVPASTQFLSAVPASPGSDMCSPPAVLSSPTTVCQLSPNTLTVPSWKQSYGMEQVWQDQFKRLFSNYAPHMWLLLPVNQKPNGLWSTNVDSAKVRFCCEDCGHGWTSMKGRVGFWFVLNTATGEGIVCLKLYGQQCERCKTGYYEPAMWYPEEVVKVLVNVYNKVGEAYYGFQQAPYHRNRRPGKPRTPHNADLCQACKDGVCSERR